MITATYEGRTGESESYWTFKMNGRMIIRASLRDIWGENIPNGIITSDWSQEAIRRIRREGIQRVRYVLTGYRHRTDGIYIVNKWAIDAWTRIRTLIRINIWN